MVLPRDASALVQKLVESVAIQTGELLSSKLLPPPEDTLIRADRAAELMACGVAGVNAQLQRYGVEPVATRPRRWRRSDILRMIQRL